MGKSIKSWLLSKLGAGAGSSTITCEQMFELAEEYRLRELAFNTCISMIANAVGKCEFRTYRDNKEIKEGEYYLWNIEPNINQNSTAFLHKLVYKLYSENEAVVISTKHIDGREMLAVADSFMKPMEYPAKVQEYQGITVGQVQYSKTYFEDEVLHFKLQHVDIKPVLDGLYRSYNTLIASAMQDYNWSSGKHYKVHVDQTGQGGENWNKDFTEMINMQVKPFLQGNNGVLPEFNGYSYEDVGGSPNAGRTTRDIRALVDDIFNFTARAFCIPPVLLFGDVAGTQDAMERWLTTCIDPLCDQIQEEIVRKRYGLDQWRKGNYLRIDTSAMLHFDLFGNAANIEKLVGSGAFSINDVRAAAGTSEIPEDWANEHFLTKNIGTVDEVARAIDKGGGE